MGAAEILLMLLVAAFVAPVAWVVAHAVRAVCHEPQPYSPCAPQRYDSLTASVPQRRQLATWAADYAVARSVDMDAIRAGSVTYDLASITAPAVPEMPPVVEPMGIPVDWPTHIAQPVPLQR